LATTHPELAAQANGWDPTTITARTKTNSHLSWICNLGHVWQATLSNRVRGTACPICSGQQTLCGYNDLATTHPELAAQANGWDPTTLLAFSNKKVSWKCAEGHAWEATVNSRSSGRGCPSCAKFGYDPSKTGWLYFLDNDELNMFQIGISNFPDYRLSKHTKGGWQVIEVRGPMDGRLTQQLETAMLHALERRGAVLGHKAGIEKFDGYSEAWMKNSLLVSSLKQLLDWIYDDEGSLPVDKKN